MTPKRSPQTPLTGRVALVAGATRGAGRGIARALADAGATVYCTGRSVKGKPSPYGRPETIEETAAMIKAAGGTAFALRVDHTNDTLLPHSFTSPQEFFIPPNGLLHTFVERENRLPTEEPAGLFSTQVLMSDLIRRFVTNFRLEIRFH